MWLIELSVVLIGTKSKFWAEWRDEEDTDEAISPFANRCVA